MEHTIIRRPEKVKVLHVITRLILGGAQQNTLITVSRLDPERFEVTLVSGPQTGSEGTIINEARQQGIRLRIMNELVREVNPLKDLRAIVRLYYLLRAERFDVVHTHSSKAGVLGRIAAWMARVPVIVHTVHGWGFHDEMWWPQRRLFITLERWAATLSDKLIVVSGALKEKGLREKIGTPGQFATIYSGIDLTAFNRRGFDSARKRKEFGIPPDAPLVGTVGRLSPQKAPEDFLAAAGKVIREIPEARFLIVGDGPLKSKVKRSINAMGLRENVMLAGIRDDIPELMALFDVFALASLWEGLPRVIPQAMAAAKPVVCTSVDGNVEAVTNGVNGFVVPPRDPEALSNAIVKLLRDPDLIKVMGEEGRKRVAVFDQDKMVEAIDALYRTLLSEKSGQVAGWGGA